MLTFIQIIFIIKEQTINYSSLKGFYKMIYKDYGKTGKMVSALGFGGMRFKEGEPKEKSAEVVIRAVELGINYLDTAPFYCHDRSEDILGIAPVCLVPIPPL